MRKMPHKLKTSVALIFANITGGSIWAVANGKISYNYWTLMPELANGGLWSITKGNTTTITYR